MGDLIYFFFEVCSDKCVRFAVRGDWKLSSGNYKIVVHSKIASLQELCIAGHRVTYLRFTFSGPSVQTVQ